MVNILSKSFLGAALLLSQFAAANPFDANRLQDLEARKIKTKTDTAKVPGQTPPPVITVTRTVTKKSGHVATETVVIVDPSSVSDAENVKRSEKELPRGEFKDIFAKREGGLLRKPAQDLEARKIKTKTDTAKVPGQTPPPVITVTRTVTKKSGKVATETVVIVDPSSASDAENVKRSEKELPRHEFQDAHAKREGGLLRKPAQDLEARKIKTKTDTAKVPGQTPPPVITVTKTVTKKSGKVATETVVIVDPSSASDAENVKRAEKELPRHEFQNAHAKREGGVLRAPGN